MAFSGFFVPEGIDPKRAAMAGVTPARGQLLFAAMAAKAIGPRPDRKRNQDIKNRPPGLA